MANQVDFKILPSDQFNVYSPQTRSDKVITYFTLLSKLRGDILAVGQEDDPNDIVSAYYSNVGGTQTLHLVKADGSEITASQSEQVISGTLNYVSKFTSSNDIGDSQIFDDGTNVGIGTTSMTHKLQLGTGGVFADYYQLDTTYSNGFVVGAISWDQDNGTADVGLSGSLKLKIGQDDVWYVKNQTGAPITKGTAVYASGTLGASSRITVAPMIADGTIPARFFLGIVAETIANGADGYVLAKGKLRQVNTNAYNEGDVLWVSPTTAGALTSTEPTAPNLKLPVAFVVYKASNGILAVRSTTGQRIEDASDVNYTGAVDNSFLVYDSATGVWVDEAVGIFKTIAVAGQSDVVADAYDDTLTLVAGTNVTITTNASTDTITINSTDQYVGTVTSVATTAPITGGTITTTGTIGITQSGAAADGYLSSTDWNTFNSKQNAITLTTTGNSGAATFVSSTLNIPTYTLTGLGGVPTTRTLTINGTAYDLSADRTWSVGTVTSIDLTAGARIEVSGGPVTSSGSITVTHGTATGADFTTAESFRDRVIADGGTFEALGEVAIAIGSLEDAASPTSTDYSDGVVLQNIAVDEFGHVLGVGATDLDERYAQVAFKNVAVSGQNTIVADAIEDTLNIEAGYGLSITTDDTTDTVTIGAQFIPYPVYAASMYESAVTLPFDVTGTWTVVNIEGTNIQLPAPVDSDGVYTENLATVTISIENQSESAAFVCVGIRLYNQTQSAIITDSTRTWTGYLDAVGNDSANTIFTYHIPIEEYVVAGDTIRVQMIDLNSLEPRVNFASFSLLGTSGPV
jgi:hypothetical protein